MEVLTGVSASEEAVLSHYRRVAPLLEPLFGAIPSSGPPIRSGPKKRRYVDYAPQAGAATQYLWVREAAGSAQRLDRWLAA